MVLINKQTNNSNFSGKGTFVTFPSWVMGTEKLLCETPGHRERQINESCQSVSQLLSRVPLCDPMGCSLPGSSVHGILLARKLE